MILHRGRHAREFLKASVRWTARDRRPVWLAVPLAAALGLGGAIGGEPRDPVPIAAAPLPEPATAGAREPGTLSILTYNVKGLPWPLASNRPQALRRIAERLAGMRREGRQPHVVVLQEAFTADAKAIGRRAGYPFVIEGPYARRAPSHSGGRDWHLGETSMAVVDSGLVLLSDFPVLGVERAAFPPEDCAGYDCLAAKGVLIAELETPDRGPVLVATTHLNCQSASGAPKARTTAAFGRQAAFLGAFLARAHARGLPVVVAGDFNQGQRPRRAALLRTALGEVNGRPVRDALSRSLLPGASDDPARNADLAAIREHARDLQFAFDGTNARIVPVGAEVPFGREPDGRMLSDHMGYTIRYRIEPFRALRPRIATN